MPAVPLTAPDPTDTVRRVALTTRVRDTDAIPKADGAGEVRDLNGRSVQLMHNGLMIDEACYGGPFMTEIIAALKGHHEPQEEIVFHRMLERLANERSEDRAPSMVELGAFWAYYSMWFQRSLPGGTTLMIEPDPNNIEVGRRNFELNGLDGTFLQAAVGGDHGGEMWLPCESDGRVRKVPTVTLEGLMAEHDLPMIDLVLCDTQGAEASVLETARPALAQGKVRFLVLSTHHQVFSGDPLTHQRCLAILNELGASIVAEHSVAESCSGDGLIAASMNPRDRDFTVSVSHVRARESLFGEPEFEVASARTLRGAARSFGGNFVASAQQFVRRERGRR